MKRLYCDRFLLVALVIGITSGVLFCGYSYVSKAENHGIINSAPQQLVEKIDDGKIILTADYDDKYYVYKNFKLRIGNWSQGFNWQSIGKAGFEPSMKLIDLGNGKNSGLAIFLVEAEGTGVFITKAHVISIDTHSEITIEDPKTIIEKHVKLGSENNNIILNIDGNKVVLDRDYLSKLGLSSNNIGNKFVYDNHIVYGVKNNRLFAVVGISNEDLLYFGSILIEYSYDNNLLKMSKISFEKV
jgi:hypothetical protein